MYETILIHFVVLIIVIKLFTQSRIQINRNRIVFRIAYDKLNTKGYLESVVRTFIINLK